MNALGKQPGRISLPQQDRQAKDGEQRPQYSAPGGPLAQQPDAEQHGQQRRQSHHQPHLGGSQGLRRVVTKSLVEHHAQRGQHGDLPKASAQTGTRTPYPTGQKRT